MNNRAKKISNVIMVLGLSSNRLLASVEPSSGDTTIWAALFGLAVIGVFALYLSSEKVKELTANFTTMQEAQTEIELKQNVILGVIGERLETSTHGIRRHREVFEEQSQGALSQEVIQNEMVRFRRDEHLLVDAMQDLNDFSQIRTGNMKLETAVFGVQEMLKRLERHVEPHYFLKRNELVYRFDPRVIDRMDGDVRRIEQILGVIMIELGQVAYDCTIILSMAPDPQNKAVTFDLIVPESEEGTQVLDTLLESDNALMDAQYSSRKLKTFIARELIVLMGGTLTSVADHEFGIHYRIVLPLKAYVMESTVEMESASSPVLVVAHNEPVALSVSDMLVARCPSDQVDLHVLDDVHAPDLSHYGTIMITHAALTEEWIARLHEAQQKYPVRLIVLKAGYERNHPIPEKLDVIQTLKLPVLPEELYTALSMPLPTEQAVS
jgi:hypothetical protein